MLIIFLFKHWHSQHTSVTFALLTGACQSLSAQTTWRSFAKFIISLHITVTSDDVLLYFLFCRRRWHLACLEDVWVSELVMRCWDTDSSGWTDSMFLCPYKLMMEVCIYMYYWQGIYCTCTSMSILALYMDVLWLGRAYIHLHTPQSQLYCIVQGRYVHAVYNLLCVIKCYQKWKSL